MEAPNPSGLVPLEFNIVVDQNPVEEKTAGGLLIPDQLQDKAKWLETRGTIVAVAPLAFNSDIWPEGEARPRPGDKIIFVKGAGTLTKGNDGREYRIIKDKDAVAVLA